ncbi:MAG: hypothetical protein ACREQJ_03300 [Candidatus Binatia bacterium]
MAAVLVVAALSAYRLGPSEIGLRVDGALTRFDRATGRGCADVSSSYQYAVRALSTSAAASSRASFDRARLACERRVGHLAGTSGDACRASSNLYARALDRRTAIANVVAVRPREIGIIGTSAAGIVGAEDIEQTEALARRMMADCGA